GPQHSAATARGRKVFQFGTVNPLFAAFQAADSPDIAMQFDDVFRARQIVQPVDILRYQRENRLRLLKRGKSVVTGVRLRPRNIAAALLVPRPDEFRVPRKTFGRGKVFETMLPPVAA